MSPELRPTRAARLGLGTVQFGLDYGLTNRRGRTDAREAHAVLRRAREAGVRTLDTAPRYGAAEEVLGAAPAGLEGWRVVTKTVEHRANDDAATAIPAELNASLARLGVPRVDALLEHRAAALLGTDADATWRGLCAARDAGLTRRVGVSVYEPDELEALLARFPIDVVQAPVNVLDRRFVTPRMLERLAQRGVALHARSVFLQGALVDVPAKSAQVADLSRRVACFQDRCASAGATPLVASLSSVLAQPQVECAIVGVEDTAQLDEVLAAADAPVELDVADLATDASAVVDPRTWPAREAALG